MALIDFYFAREHEITHSDAYIPGVGGKMSVNATWSGDDNLTGDFINGRHNYRVNIVYFDGHAKPVDVKEPGTHYHRPSTISDNMLKPYE